ncbi:hypothetical protein [Nocardioides sp.]|uniref:hypothetical protein n=1 Tax=Nocardioides sp. TaxID=35761 RepID=UPI00351948D5
MRRTRYRLLGLEVDSALDLPATPGGDPTTPADVVVEQGPLEPLAAGRWAERRDGGLRVDVPSGRVAVWRDRVVVDVAAGAPMLAGAVAAGAGLGALHLLRAIPLLHVAAVDVGGRALAIGGHGGRGKSTMAAALAAAGAVPLCDDAASVVVRDGTAVLNPGPSWLKVTTAAGAPAEAAPVPTQRERDRRYRTAAPGPEALPVRAVHLITLPEDDLGTPGVPLRGTARTRARALLFHGLRLTHLSDDPEALEARRLEVLGALDLVPLPRPDGLAAVAETARRLLAGP